MIEAIGWASSIVLVLTISRQVYRQWQAGTSKGVSVWLFVGQIVASLGFLTYSVLIHNYVFVVTNALMACAAVLGVAIVAVHRRRESHPGRESKSFGSTASFGVDP